jgi:S-formylglutathione hydrolase
LDATTEKYKTHYNMYNFVVHELPEVVEDMFNVTQMRAICGHSMGGHLIGSPDLYTTPGPWIPFKGNPGI